MCPFRPRHLAEADQAGGGESGTQLCPLSVPPNPLSAALGALVLWLPPRQLLHGRTSERMQPGLLPHHGQGTGVPGPSGPRSVIERRPPRETSGTCDSDVIWK